MKSEIIEGLQITGFFGQSQIEDIGLKIGDWILEYNNEKVKSKSHLEELEVKYQHLQSIFLKVLKSNSEEYFQILPGELGVYLAEREQSPKVLSDAKRIEKVSRLEKKTGRENTFFGSLINILRFYKVKVSFDDLICLSSFPYRIQFDENFSMDCLNPIEGFNCAEFILHNFEIKFKQIKKSKKNDIPKAIIESIDRKIPILAKDLFGKNEWGIITGYQNSGKELFCRSYVDKTIDYSIASQFPNQIIIFEKPPQKNKIVNSKEKISISIKNAELMFSSEKIGKYFLGNFALEKWQKILENESFFESLSDKKFYQIFQNNKLFFYHYSFQFGVLSDCFNNYIQVFPKSKEHLKRLSKFYRAESKILKDCQKFIPASTIEEVKKFWTNEFRNKEAVALIKIQKKNKEIFRVLEKLPLLKK